ncbi:MAG: hypothetical protein LPK11_03175 [Chromatiaceae bacterium]|nr:hypothetical protein [Chromatiaceae bacterium]
MQKTPASGTGFCTIGFVTFLPISDTPRAGEEHEEANDRNATIKIH